MALEKLSVCMSGLGDRESDGKDSKRKEAEDNGGYNEGPGPVRCGGEHRGLMQVLKLLLMIRLLRKQMEAAQEAKKVHRMSMRKREGELRGRRKAATNLEVTQFFMLHRRITTRPWSWVTGHVLVGVMPIKTRLNHASGTL